MNSVITVALPKGRLAEDTIELFLKKGILDNSCVDFNSRKLIFEDKNKGFRFLIVRNMDVPTYVEYGACDLGIVGKDIICETQANVYEFMDLGFGYCKLCIASLEKDFKYKHDIKIATKFVNITKDYFINKGFFVETIKLYGSIEIAPLLGLSDIIVDLVSTGETLKKNGLFLNDTIMESTARLIGNKNLTRSKYDKIKDILEMLRG
ncbi:MAG: ATP phosphoribosyltransferase [Calditerrivibrio sp.]|nr:ATP phosphoribosyltransferase [Calditerrivibrio sp.]MCA1933733.1 ATP phosphoribosyltransferase [Calditerrivibrio sp.]MCA1980838.1 ATP phosphoribosyltransferase [Calditerrivibrio sp.]